MLAPPGRVVLADMVIWPRRKPVFPGRANLGKLAAPCRPLRGIPGAEIAGIWNRPQRFRLNRAKYSSFPSAEEGLPNGTRIFRFPASTVDSDDRS